MLPLLALCCALVFPAVQESRPPLADPVALLRAPAVVGVGLADGLGLKEEFGARVSMGDIAGLELLGDHGPLLDLGSSRAWVQIEPNARQWIHACQSKSSTLVLAPDFLWWFVYRRDSDAERLARFERALTMLEGLSVPVLLGDLPDFSPALAASSRTGAGGPQLAPDRLPSCATLEALRKRLAEWAATRPLVVLVPLAGLYERIHAGRALELRGNAWADDKVAGLLQADRVHPTVEGSILFTLACWDELLRAWPVIAAEGFDWSVASVRERLLASKASERAEELARKRRRQEEDRPPPPPPPAPVPPEKQRDPRRREE